MYEIMNQIQHISQYSPLADFLSQDKAINMLTYSRMYNINLCIHSCGRTCMSMLRPIAYLIHSTSMVTCIDQIPFCFKFKTWLIHIYALLKHPLHSINSTHALLINIQNYIRPQHTSCWPNFFSIQQHFMYYAEPKRSNTQLNHFQNT